MCDNIAAAPSATLSGTVLFGKNSDREFNEAQLLEMHPARRYASGARVRMTYKEIDQARETYAVLFSKPHWIWGTEIGANEHGLVIGNEAIWTKIEPSLEPGVLGMDYIRLAVERGRTVDEAIHVITTLLREHGQGGKAGFRRETAYQNSYLIADPKQIKVLETVDREWVVKPVKDFDAISNAVTISDFTESSPTLRARAEQAGLEIGGASFKFNDVYENKARMHSAQHRRGRALHLLGEKSGSLQLTDFFAVLRDHVEGFNSDGGGQIRICAHRKDNPLGQTTGSLVADLTPGKHVYWVTGTAAPCTGLFKPVTFETGIPEHGPAPGADEEETASLWWRHQRIREGLDRCSDELRQTFEAQRDALEASFLERVYQNGSDMRRVVAGCWREGVAFENEWFERLTSPTTQSFRI